MKDNTVRQIRLISRKQRETVLRVATKTCQRGMIASGDVSGHDLFKGTTCVTQSRQSRNFRSFSSLCWFLQILPPSFHSGVYLIKIFSNHFVLFCWFYSDLSRSFVCLCSRCFHRSIFFYLQHLYVSCMNLYILQTSRCCFDPRIHVSYCLRTLQLLFL